MSGDDYTAARAALQIERNKNLVIEAGVVYIVGVARLAGGLMELSNLKLDKGDLFAGYRITEKLGPGVMGVVYLARDTREVRRVALKVLTPDLKKDEEYVRLFNEQAEAAKASSHNNVSRLFDYGEEQGLLYTVSEFIQGKTLAALIESQGRLDVQIALSLLVTIGKALLYLHSQGVVHGGVNPGNIRMDKLGEVKLVDAGLAKKLVLRPQGPEESAQVTPVYLAPELIRRPSRIDARADIYSLGITAFEALTGQQPFTGGSHQEMVLRIMNEPITKESMKGVPSELAELIESMVEKNPDDRPGDMGKVLERMETLAQKYAPVVVGAGPSETSRQAMDRRRLEGHKKLFFGIAVALVVILVAVLFLIPGRKREDGGTGGAPTKEQQAAKAIEEAQSYQVAHPEDPMAAMELYRKVYETFPETPLAQKAKDAERKIAYRLTREKAEGMSAEGLLHEAALAFDSFAQHYSGTPESSRALDEKSGILKEIEDKFNEAILQSALLTQKDRNEEAIAVLEEIEKYGAPGHAQRARSEIDKIRRSKGVVELAGAHAGAWQAAEPMLAVTTGHITSGEPGKALRAINTFLTSPLPKGVVTILEWEKEDIGRRGKVRESFMEAIGVFAEMQVEVSLTLKDGTEIKGKVTEEDGAYFLVISESSKWRINPRDLRTESVLKLAGMAVKEPGAAVTSALYYLYSGDGDKALAVLNQVSGELDEETLARYTNKIALVSSIPSIDMAKMREILSPKDIRRAAELIESARKSIKNGNWDLAYDVLREAARLNPVEAETWSLLGRCAAEKNLPGEAVEHYRKALSFNTRNAILWNELGKLYLKQGELGLALVSFGQTARMNPSDPVAAQGRIEALMQLGQEEKARKVREEWEKTRNR